MALPSSPALPHLPKAEPARALEVRERELHTSSRAAAACAESRRPPAAAITNGDEALYPNLIASFTKGFLHTQLGEIDQSQGSHPALLYALSTQQHSDFKKIPIGYVRKMVNPESAFAYDLDGGDSPRSTCFRRLLSAAPRRLPKWWN